MVSLSNCADTASFNLNTSSFILSIIYVFCGESLRYEWVLCIFRGEKYLRMVTV